MKKQLLKESEVRKLMKFANIGGLTDGFVSKLTEADMMDPEEEEGGDHHHDHGMGGDMGMGGMGGMPGMGGMGGMGMPGMM